jgi:peptidoglycan/xylan/chitin deacetylase (PgdA/CDA1 family)
MKMRSKTYKLITSWDDGSPYDLKVAELLEKYNVPAVFYIPVRNPERKVMTKFQIRQISSKFEIGGHTFSHIDLISISPMDARNDILKGKQELEDIIGKRIKKFSYPWGKSNQLIKNIVRNLGFKSARTARIIFTGKSRGFSENPNLHIYNHRLQTYLVHCMKERDAKTLYNVMKLRRFGFLDVAKVLYRKEFHIWGHSWEIEEKKLWSDLEGFIRFVGDS